MLVTDDSGSSSRAPDARGVSVAKWLVDHRTAVVAGIAVLAASLWLMHAGALPIVPPGRAFAVVRWWTVPVYLAIWLVVHWLRCARWYWLLQPIHPVPMRRTVAVALVGYAALLVLPLRLGEAVRPAMIRRKGELSAWAAAGTVAADRIIDGLFFAILLFAGLRIAKPIAPLPDHIGKLPVPASVVPAAAYGAVIVFTVAFLVTALFYWRRSLARTLTSALIGRVSSKLAERVDAILERLADGLSFLPRARYTLPFLGITAVVWLLNIAGVWFLMWGCGFDGVTAAQSTVISGVLALGVIAPNAPGFFGAFQISVYAGMALYLAPERVVHEGAVFVFLLYVCQVVVMLAAAAIALATERMSAAQVLAASDG